jgi:hypothetical protein
VYLLAAKREKEKAPTTENATAKQDAVGRETAQIFDRIFKQLMRLSNATIIQFINGLFGVVYRPELTGRCRLGKNVQMK